MKDGVQGRHEEVPSRHPLAALPFATILTFVGGRGRRGTGATGGSPTPAAEQVPAVADRRGICSLLAAAGVGRLAT
jgi:hypothetical protein